jgi:hypothetical protein
LRAITLFYSLSPVSEESSLDSGKTPQNACKKVPVSAKTLIAAEIIVPVWIVSFAAAFCGIMLSKILSRREIGR